jgi:pimeloyl-ACP methyl ester carboxylesterase
VSDVADATLAPGFSERYPEKAHLYRQIAELNRGIASRVIPKLIAVEGDGFIQPDELANYRIPTLVLSAPADRLIPKGLLMHIAEVFPGARFVEFPTAVGHTSYFEDPDTFNVLMDGFLSEHHA